jgi:L-amino acid N-acyltransferase YncA
MIHYLGSIDEIQFHDNQKASYAQVLFRGLDIRLISWYDVNNVDLWDIDCAPYYKAQDGTVNNFVTSSLINEGMDNGLKIRRAFPCDIIECSELWGEMAKEEDEKCSPDTIGWVSQMFNFISKEENHFYVAIVDKKIVGFVSGFWEYEPMYKKNRIIGVAFYVKKTFRKKGIGKRLHERYLAEAKKLGVDTVIQYVNKNHAKTLGFESTYCVLEEKL